MHLIRDTLRIYIFFFNIFFNIYFHIFQSYDSVIYIYEVAFIIIFQNIYFYYTYFWITQVWSKKLTYLLSISKISFNRLYSKRVRIRFRPWKKGLCFSRQYLTSNLTHKMFGIPDSYNTNISHELFDYIIHSSRA